MTQQQIKRTLTGLLLIVAVLFNAGQVMADGDPSRGESKALVCSACHGADGNSFNPEWPSLAGQHEAYTVKQLKAFKDGGRVNPLMSSQAVGLTEDDMNDLAAFYARKTMTPKTADPALVAIGERLYRGGNKNNGVSACIACHGPTGRGNKPAGYPSIGGQYAAYTKAQLSAYADGDRRSDTNEVMRSIAGLMSENEIEAVASYIQGLRDE